MRLEDVLVGASEETANYYKSLAGRLERHSGKPVEKLTVSDVLSFLSDGEKQGWSRRTLLNYFNVIRSMMRYLGKHDVEAELKVHLKKMGKYPYIPGRGIYVPPEYVTKMIESTDSLEEKSFIALAIFSGLRLKELRSLRVKDLNLKRRLVNLPVQKFMDEKGKPLVVTVAMNSVTADILRRYISIYNLGPNDLLFTKSKRTYQYMVKRVAKFAGVPNWKEITPHKLRHTTAIIGALAAREGRVDPETIRRQLRWRNINMLSTYADMSEALFREGYDRAYEVGYGGGEEEDTMRGEA